MSKVALVAFLLLLCGNTSLALANEPAPAASKFLVLEECRGGYAYMARYECVLRLWQAGKPVCGRWELQDLKQLFVNVQAIGMYKHSNEIMIVKECK